MTIVARGLGIDTDSIGSLVAFGLTSGRSTNLVLDPSLGYIGFALQPFAGTMTVGPFGGTATYATSTSRRLT